MGSIPLPALSIHNYAAQQQPDLGEQYGRLLALKNQMALAPLQQQALQQENQQRQMQINDQQAMTKAMQSWDGKDLNALPTLVLKNGGSANAVMGLKQKSLEMQKQYSDIAAQDATTGSKQIETLQKRNDQVSGAFSSVLQVPDEQLPQAILSKAQELAQQGLLDPQHLQMAQQIAQAPPDQARQQLDLMRKGMMANSQLLTEAKDKAETDKNTGQAAEATARASQILQQMQYGPAGEFAKAKHQFITQKIQAGTATPEEIGWDKAYITANGETTTSADSLGVTSTNTRRPSGAVAPRVGGAPAAGGGAPLPASNIPSNNPLSPANAKQNIVDLIGQYRADPATFSRLMNKHPDLIGLVGAKYPDWDQTSYQAKNKLIQSYTSGQDSKSINAINTAMGHVKVLDDAVDALKNGNIQLLNQIGNKVGAATGSTPQTTFQAIVHRVGPEITTAYLPSGGGEGERIANEKDFSENLAPQQLHDNAAVTVKLLRSKVGALENQYKNTVGRDDFNQRFITPEAQAAFQKFGGAQGAAPSALSVTAPNGKVYTFKSQADADAFKQKAGIQ